jgi:hypothetical protein
VIWAGEWAEDPGDDEILARAHREGRVLVTLDKDFGELAVVHGQPRHNNPTEPSKRRQATPKQLKLNNPPRSSSVLIHRDSSLVRAVRDE